MSKPIYDFLYQNSEFHILIKFVSEYLIFLSTQKITGTEVETKGTHHNSTISDIDSVERKLNILLLEVTCIGNIEYDKKLLTDNEKSFLEKNIQRYKYRLFFR